MEINSNRSNTASGPNSNNEPLGYASVLSQAPKRPTNRHISGGYASEIPRHFNSNPTQLKPGRTQDYNSRSPTKHVVESNHNRSWLDATQSSRQRETILFKNTAGIKLDHYSTIPVEIKSMGETPPIPPINKFQDLDLGPVLTKNLELAGWKEPTPIQKYSLPILFAGADLIGCAQTGSGKTAAYLVPIIHSLIADRPKRESVGLCAYPFALILAPVRELCQQIHVEAAKFCFRSSLRPVAIYGGSGHQDQLSALQRGCDILIATPGRLLEYIDNGHISLRHLRCLCLDEADRMMAIQEHRGVSDILKICPRHRQTIMFSATFPEIIQNFARTHLRSEHFFCSVGRVGSTIGLITQHVIPVRGGEKFRQLLDELAHNPVKTLVFVETKGRAQRLTEQLLKGNIRVAAIHSQKDQHLREKSLEAFKSGEALVLIATGIAARGIDIPRVGHVINYDMTNNIDDYVHRIGRTGRVGHEGVATSFFTSKNLPVAADLLKILEEQQQAIPFWLKEKNAHFLNGQTQPELPDWNEWIVPLDKAQKPSIPTVAASLARPDFI